MSTRRMTVPTVALAGTSLAVALFFSLSTFFFVRGMDARAAAGTERSASESPLAAGTPLVAMDEIYANVGVSDAGQSVSIALKIELELFSEKGRDLIETYEIPITDSILQAAREQGYSSLQTIQGKLFFKEQLVGRINEVLNNAVVRDVHFASFYMQ